MIEHYEFEGTRTFAKSARNSQEAPRDGNTTFRASHRVNLTAITFRNYKKEKKRIIKRGEERNKNDELSEKLSHKAALTRTPVRAERRA